MQRFSHCFRTIFQNYRRYSIRPWKPWCFDYFQFTQYRCLIHYYRSHIGNFLATIKILKTITVNIFIIIFFYLYITKEVTYQFHFGIIRYFSFVLWPENANLRWVQCFLKTIHRTSKHQNVTSSDTMAKRSIYSLKYFVYYYLLVSTTKNIARKNVSEVIFLLLTFFFEIKISTWLYSGFLFTGNLRCHLQITFMWWLL